MAASGVREAVCGVEMVVCGVEMAVGSIAGGGRAVIYQRIKVGVICLIEDFQIRQAGVQHTGSGLFGDAAYQRFAEFEVKLLVLMFSSRLRCSCILRSKRENSLSGAPPR